VFWLVFLGRVDSVFFGFVSVVYVLVAHWFVLF